MSTLPSRPLAPLFLSLVLWFSSFGMGQAGTYDEWVQANNLSGATSDPTNAPAGDGVPNLLKFAMSLEPLTPGAGPQYQPIIVERDGQRFPGLRLTLNTGAEGVRLDLFGSQDLRTWTPCAVLLEPLADLGSGVLLVQLLNSQALSASEPLFLRLGAEFTSFGQFVTGPAVPVLTSSLGTDGATLTVQAPGTPLDGLALDVPAGANSGPQNFTISYAPIVAHNFPASITPVTPLIHIDNGGVLADQIMTVTIPLNLSPDEFAMGFIYHEDTGELEGLPFVALSTNSITIATRHFSQLFISRIAYNLLPKNADSGFQPGVDDWEFTNYGSFLATGGQCSGQSQSAMWYYCERKIKANAPPLYNLYDNSLYSFRTSNYGQDNVLGIKLASRVQKDTDWHSPAYQFVANSPVRDIDTLAAFTYTIWVTHEPQLVLIWSPDSAHAMMAYRVENGTNIYVADPNYPGVTTRQIRYDVAGRAFQPYLSGDNAANLGTPYPTIRGAFKTAINDWAKIKQRWGEFEAGTIASGDFPVLKIKMYEFQAAGWAVMATVTNDKPSEVPIQTGADQIQTYAEYVSGPAITGDPSCFTYDTNGTRLDLAPDWLINLAAGTNRLGVELRAKKAPDTSWWWAGFAWLTVNCTNQGYAFTTLAGQTGTPGGANGTGTAAHFRNPYGVAVDNATNVYVADYGNDTIRKITPDGVVSTLAGQATMVGSTDGTSSHARFFSPIGVAVDANTNVYVADYGNNTIRKITPDGVVSTLAGSASSSGSADGTGSAARFNGPAGIAMDRWGTSLIVADKGNNTIRRVRTTAGEVTTLAGLAGSTGGADGTNTDARFNMPHGVAVGSDGNVYVSDSHNYTIRKITQVGSDWVVTTVAGEPGVPGSSDGRGTNAHFNVTRGLAADRMGNIYAADTYNDTIRRVTPSGMVTTLAGQAGVQGSADLTNTNALFYYPWGVAVATNGNLYVADGNNHTIRKGRK